MKNINYTFIIPHSNQPELLRKCLSTIPSRDDIQIIIIDDKSDSQHLEELEKIKESFYYADFIGLKEKRGAGHARNVGLAKAIGKWVIFADSDDFFLPDLLIKLDLYKDSSCQLVYFFTTSIFLDSDKVANRHVFTNEILSKYIATEENTINDIKCLLLGPCSKMFLREIITKNKILFDEVPVANDTLFALKFALKSNVIDVSSQIIYCITSSPNSTIHRNSPDLIKVRLGVYLRANSLYSMSGLNKYKFNIAPLFFSARKYGLFAVLDTARFLTFFFPNSFSLFFYITKDLFLYFKGIFLKKFFHHSTPSLYRS